MLAFETISGKIVLKSGLHIGGTDNLMSIGKVDKEVIKHAHTHEPFIPGSSLKGKIRSLLEQKYGLCAIFEGGSASTEYIEMPKKLYGNKQREFQRIHDKIKQQNKAEDIKKICKLFGDTSKNKIKQQIGTTRSIFRDSFLTDEFRAKQLDPTEIKPENSVNCRTSEANPRFFERVVEGVEFDFEINVKIMTNSEKTELLTLLFEGIELLQQDYLGGHGSRGSGKVEFIFDETTQELKDSLQ